MTVDVIEVSREIIRNNKYLSLATTDGFGHVWSSPLSYAIDENYNFYFTTAVDSIHIEFIKKNPYVAFSIFDSTKRVSDIDGLQISGIVGEVEKDDLPKIVKMYYQQVFPDPIERKEWEAPADFFLKDDFPVYRFFQIMPEEIHKRDTENISVDRRIQIDLKELKKAISKHPGLNL